MSTNSASSVSNWSALSIRHPIPAILLFMLLTLAGVMGYRAMKVQNRSKKCGLLVATMRWMTGSVRVLNTSGAMASSSAACWMAPGGHSTTAAPCI